MGMNTTAARPDRDTSPIEQAMIGLEQANSMLLCEVNNLAGRLRPVAREIPQAEQDRVAEGGESGLHDALLRRRDEVLAAVTNLRHVQSSLTI